MMRPTLVAAFMVLIPPALAFPQSLPPPPDLVTDRPDFTESAVTVPRGSLQLEAGVSWERDPDGGRVFAGPELLLRWGVLDRLELRLEAPDHVRFDGGSGFSDLSAGVKWQLGPLAPGWDLAVIAAVSLPTGSSQLTSDAVDPVLLLTTSYDLDERWSVGTQVAFARPTEEGGRTSEWGATAVAGLALADRWGTFFELAAVMPQHSDTSWLLHHGYTYALGPLLQLDLHAGVGLTDSAPDWLAGAGLAVRW